MIDKRLLLTKLLSGEIEVEELRRAARWQNGFVLGIMSEGEDVVTWSLPGEEETTGSLEDFKQQTRNYKSMIAVIAGGGMP